MNELIPLNQIAKIDAATVSSSIKEFFENDELDDKTIVDTRVGLSKLQAAIDEANKDERVKQIQLSALEKLLGGEKSVKVGNSKVEVMTVSSYDFSNCNHPELTFINDLIAALTRRKKAIEEELKSISDSTFSFNSDGKGSYSGQFKDIVLTYDTIRGIDQMVDNCPFAEGEVVTVYKPLCLKSPTIKISKK